MKRIIKNNIYMIRAAASAINHSNYLVVTAGAGMGVDSGLPDFRGDEGFWKAYPPFARLGLSFPEVSNPSRFEQHPNSAWGFYGHRHYLYSSTVPHRGYSLLRSWGTSKKYGYSVFTSNIDGHFQKAGFPEETVVECHGAIQHLQCKDSYKCTGDIWLAEALHLEVNEEFVAKDPLPKCPHCGGLARPNVLMFGDWGWVSERTDAQLLRFEAQFQSVRGHKDRNVCVIEIGAGTAVPTVRRFSASLLLKDNRSVLIRINPAETEGKSGKVITIRSGALKALSEINSLVS